jgi:hypothetical protein
VQGVYGVLRVLLYVPACLDDLRHQSAPRTVSDAHGC